MGAAKDKEIDAVQLLIDAQQNKIKSMSEKETDSRSKIQGLLSERDTIRSQINDKLKEKDKARQIFREANNAWYDYQRAVRAQRKMQQEEERQKREEERLAILKAKEEEELKKIPYEEEQMLCDYLADYLTKTYLTDPSTAKQLSKKKDDAFKAVDAKDDPSAGFKPMIKKTDEIFLKMGSDKKRSGMLNNLEAPCLLLMIFVKRTKLRTENHTPTLLEVLLMIPLLPRLKLLYHSLMMILHL